MERTDDMNDMDDMEFAQLFSSLDSIKASEDLKSATLDAIFSATGTDPTPTGDDAENKVVKFPRNRSHHKNSHRLRIAGIAACFALLGTIGTAYNMPSSYACVDDGDTNVTIGINSMGMAVSADSDSEKGKKLIEENKLTNVDYRDSVGTAAASIAEHSDTPESTIELSVKSKDKAERDSVKKGSSEAIEISGYKKNAKPASKSSSKASDSTNTAPTADSKNSSSSTAQADSDEDNGGSSFTINTNDAKNQKSSTETNGSADSSSKYHPLSDDTKNADADTKAEAEQSTDSGSEATSANDHATDATAAAVSSSENTEE